MATRGRYAQSNLYFADNILSPARGSTLWERFARYAIASDPYVGIYRHEDFDSLTIASNTIGGWTYTSVTSGSITQDTTNGMGVVKISAGAATANQGSNWQLNVPLLTIATNKPVAFEAYGNFSGLTNLRLQTFIGLAETSTALIASGAMATKDRIGFQGITTSGVLTSVARGGGTAATGTGVTLANTTNYRFGVFATTSQVDFYINGAIVSSSTTQIPTGAIQPSFVVQANGTDTPVLNLDYVAYGGFR